MFNKIGKIILAFSIALLITIATSRATPAFAGEPVSFYIVAHGDDWPLFMEPAGSAAYQRIVFIITTSVGAIGYPVTYNKNLNSMPEYLAVEEGHKAAVRFVADLDQPQPYVGAIAAAKQVKIGTHTIYNYTYRNTSSYLLRLPDGGDVPFCSGGSSAAPYVNKCLASLRAGVGTLTAVDGSTTYANWQDLINTIASIIKTESVGATAIGINAQDPDPSANEDDNPDHYYTGDAVTSATNSITTSPVPALWLWCGYGVALNPPNLLCDAAKPIDATNCGALINKAGTYGAMTSAIAAASYSGYWDPDMSPSRVNWLSRLYARIRNGPQNYCGAPHQ